MEVKTDNSQSERGKPHRSYLSTLSRLLGSLYRATLVKASFREILIGIGICSILVLIMQVGFISPLADTVIGKPATRNVFAPRDVKDPYETARSRESAAERASREAEQDPANWYIAPESGSRAEINLNQFRDDLQRARGERQNSLPGDKWPIFTELRKKWADVPLEALTTLLQANQAQLDQWLEEVRRLLIAMEENKRISDLDLASFREMLPATVRSLNGNPDDKVAIGVLHGLVRPNLALDQNRISIIVDQARQRVEEVWYRSGQPILENGEIVSREKMQLLKTLHLVPENNNLLTFFSLVVFVIVLVVLAVGYLYRFRPEILRQERMLYLLALTMIIAALIGRFFTLNPQSNLAYFAPVTFASIIIVMLLDAEVAMMMTVLLSMLMGVVTGLQLSFTFYTLIGGSVAVFVLSQKQQRSELIMSGLFIGLANMISVLLLIFLNGVTPSLKTAGLLLALAAFNGVTSAVIAIGLLPFLENLFGLTSSIRLLEIANPNQHLLRELLVNAPGTYHHSIIVGNLAETAANAIGADALLVRVGAYYHDIGKIKRPYFFAENQIAQDNPHEKLSPFLSTLIIIAHVKEGVDLARQASLPEPVVDILEQHHGTDLVRYFYARAAENSQADLAENDFRYDGPRPQSKEAALVMLADSVEAAVRSMTKPTPAKIEALITRIVKERLDDGQFNQCDLTLKDLELTGMAFLKVLGGIFHTRVEYPESALREFERKKGQNGDTRKQPAG